MSQPALRFVFQNAPGLPFGKWYSKFDNSLEDKNVKIFLFGDRSLANTCFLKSIIQKRCFFNVFCDEDLIKNIDYVNNYIKKYCESMLVKGAFSESPLKFDTDADLVLRNYEKINLKEFFKDEWHFYYTNKSPHYYRLSDQYGNMPFGYIWSFFFTEDETETLVFDDYVLENKHMFQHSMKLTTELEPEKKYKIIFWDMNKYKFDINKIMGAVKENGLLLVRNGDFEVPNMIGWRDVRNRMLGVVKV
jgi:hypothetical protein